MKQTVTLKQISLQDDFIDLLRWIKQSGIIPVRVGKQDRFLSTKRRTILCGRDAREAHTLWIPNPEGLRRLGLRVREQRRSDGIEIVLQEDSLYIWAKGLDVETACLSLFQRMREIC